MSDGYAMSGKDIDLYLTIIKLHEQQQYMYDNRVHSVEHRIVSISQPWFRPIVRGKIKAPVEFGAEFDLNLDSEGYGRIEKISFEASCISATLFGLYCSMICFARFSPGVLSFFFAISFILFLSFLPL